MSQVLQDFSIIRHLPRTQCSSPAMPQQFQSPVVLDSAWLDCLVFLPCQATAELRAKWTEKAAAFKAKQATKTTLASSSQKPRAASSKRKAADSSEATKPDAQASHDRLMQELAQANALPAAAGLEWNKREGDMQKQLKEQTERAHALQSELQDAQAATIDLAKQKDCAAKCHASAEQQWDLENEHLLRQLQE